MPRVRLSAGRLGAIAVVSALLVTLGAPGVAPAGAASPLIVSPRGDALVTSKSVRVVVRRRAGASTRVLLRGRDVTKRFRRRGRQLVGRLSRRDRVRYGRNHLVVASKVRGKPRQKHARVFYFLRRHNRSVRLRRNGHNPVRIRIDVVSRPSSRLRLARRPRTIRIRLNGRSATKALVATTGTRWTASLSASHGLRHGINRLRVLVAEPRHGRYAFFSRRFRVRRDRPLAAAGRDQVSRTKMRVRLGGRSKAARHGRLRYRWTLVRKPRGSRARLSGGTRARPSLVTDRHGRYVARLRVSEYKRGRASASQLGRVATDSVSVRNSPSLSALYAVSANADAKGDPRGVQFGDPKQGGIFYPHNGPGGSIQWLLLSRTTLAAEAVGGMNNGNTWCCGAGANSLETLTDALKKSASSDQMLIITMPSDRQTPLPKANHETFNEALDTIGVDRLTEQEFGKPDQQITILGIPSAGAGTGWRWKRLAAIPPVNHPAQGWLALENTQRFRFQPLRLPFNTSSQSTPTSNTMTIAGKTAVSQPLPATETAGFHVVEVDPRDLSFSSEGNRTFAYNPDDLDTMSQFLSGVLTNGQYAAVQSIGQLPTDDDPIAPRLDAINDEMVALGANPHLINLPAKEYAFFGGPPLTRRQVAQSNSEVVVDPTKNPAAKETGTLSGNVRMQRDGAFSPSGGASTANSGDSLYDVIFNTEPKAWPYTVEAGDPDAGAYMKAIKYITNNLGPDFTKDPKWSDDVRKFYALSRDYNSWGKAISNLDGIQYPGDVRTISCPAGPDQPGDTKNGFTRKQFCALKTQLRTEFSSLDDSIKFTIKLTGGIGDALDTGAGNLQSVTDDLVTAVQDPDTSVVSPVLYLLQSLAELGEVMEFTQPEIGVFMGLIADSYDLATEAASDTNGKPIDEQINDTAKDLEADLHTMAGNARDTIDSLRGVAISDWGRLQAFGAMAIAQEDRSNQDVEDAVVSGNGRFFSSGIVQSLLNGNFTIMRLDGQLGTNAFPDPGTCRYSWGGAPTEAYVPFRARPGFPTTLMFSYVGSINSDYPAPDVLDQMFAPPTQGSDKYGKGYGIEKSTWFWEQLRNTGSPSNTRDTYPCR